MERVLVAVWRPCRPVVAGGRREAFACTRPGRRRRVSPCCAGSGAAGRSIGTYVRSANTPGRRRIPVRCGHRRSPHLQPVFAAALGASSERRSEPLTCLGFEADPGVQVARGASTCGRTSASTPRSCGIPLDGAAAGNLKPTRACFEVRCVTVCRDL